MKTHPFKTVFSAGESWPHASVIIPLYNYAGMVTETLDCLPRQTCSSLGLVIVDDASTDNSLDVAHHWCLANAHRFGALRLVSHIENGGLSRARNTGIEVAQSAYLFFLDADNHIYPACVERLAEALDQTDAAFAFSQLEVFGSRSGVIGTRVFDAALLAKGNYIDAMALIRRDVLVQMGGYRVMKHGWEDFELWLRLAGAGRRGIQVPEILGRYRSHAASMLNVSTAPNAEILKAELLALHPWFEMAPMPRIVPPKVSAAAAGYWRYAKIALQHLAWPRIRQGERVRLLRNMLSGWRRRRLPGVAAALREVEAAVGPSSKVPPKWLPIFDDSGRSHALSVPPNGIRLESKRFAIVAQTPRADQVEEVSSLLPKGVATYWAAAPGDGAGTRPKTRGAGLKPAAKDVSALGLWSHLAEAAKHHEFVLLLPINDEESRHGLSASYISSFLELAAAAFLRDDALAALACRRGASSFVEAPGSAVSALMASTGVYADPSLKVTRPPMSAPIVFRSSRFLHFFEAVLSLREVHDGADLENAAFNLCYLFCEQSGSNWAELDGHA